MRPGEVYLADVGAADKRPIIIVSRDILNQGAYVVAVPTTTTRLEERYTYNNCVRIRAGEAGLSKDCVAQCEQIATIETDFIDSTPIGEVSEEQFREIVRAIGFMMNATCEPD